MDLHNSLETTDWDHCEADSSNVSSCKTKTAIANSVGSLNTTNTRNVNSLTADLTDIWAYTIFTSSVHRHNSVLNQVITNDLQTVSVLTKWQLVCCFWALHFLLFLSNSSRNWWLIFLLLILKQETPAVSIGAHPLPLWHTQDHIRHKSKAIRNTLSSFLSPCPPPPDCCWPYTKQCNIVVSLTLPILLAKIVSNTISQKAKST